MKYLVNNDLHDFEKFLKSKVPYGDLTLMLKDGTTKLYDVKCRVDKLGNASFTHEANPVMGFNILKILYTVDVNIEIELTDTKEHSPFITFDDSYFKANETYIVKYVETGDHEVKTGILKCSDKIKVINGKFIFDVSGRVISSRRLFD